MTDYEIIERLKAGDNEAVDLLYGKYGNQALRTAALITSDIYGAEDVVQEAFIKCITSINSLKNPDSFKSWFYRILTRIAWRYTKKKSNCILVDDITVYADQSVSDEYFKNEKYSQLYEEINRLNYKLKTTVILFYFNNMTIKEIASSMGCLEGTVKSRLFTAKRKLRDSVRRYYDEQYE